MGGSCDSECSERRFDPPVVKTKNCNWVAPSFDAKKVPRKKMMSSLLEAQIARGGGKVADIEYILTMRVHPDCMEFAYLYKEHYVWGEGSGQEGGGAIVSRASGSRGPHKPISTFLSLLDILKEPSQGEAYKAL